MGPLGALPLVGYYASFHPDVSVDPDRLLNPVDPFFTPSQKTGCT